MNQGEELAEKMKGEDFLKCLTFVELSIQKIERRSCSRHMSLWGDILEKEER